MPSRVFHHKSRHGCFNCKQRRKRCDQRRPKCSGCARRRIACVYDQVVDSVVDMNVQSHSLVRPLATEWATIDPSVQAILSLQVPHVGFSDVEMIDRFRTRDPTTLDAMPGIFAVRRLNLIKTVPDYPYLLYGLITASVLHSKSSMGPGSESSRLALEEKATSFYQLSLSAYRTRLNVIDENTCSSIFSFSVTLAGLTFGLIHPERADNHDYSQAYIDGIIDIFNLLLGAVAIANQPSCMISVAENPLMLPIRASLTHGHNSAKGTTHGILDLLPSKIHAAHTIECSRNREARLVDISVIYETAIPELRNMFFSLQKPGPNDVLWVFSWAAFVGRPFVSLLKQRHPAALVVLAHYGVALQALNRVWWLRGVGTMVIGSVAEYMTHHSEEWRKLLHWPMKMIGRPDLSVPEVHAAHMFRAGPLENRNHESRNTKSFEISLAITQTLGIFEPSIAFPNHDLGAV